jgi:hypothetical protein
MPYSDWSKERRAEYMRAYMRRRREKAWASLHSPQPETPAPLPQGFNNFENSPIEKRHKLVKPSEVFQDTVVPAREASAWWWEKVAKISPWAILCALTATGQFLPVAITEKTLPHRRRRVSLLP